MKRLVVLSVLALFTSFSANATFLDRIVFHKKQERLARIEEASMFLSRIPFAAIFQRSPTPPDVFAVNGVFEQKLDHFDSSNDRSFKQRYWINSSYAEGENAPVFYNICGEWRCSSAGGFVNVIAREWKAHVVTLEHRYYGDSIPTATYSASNLRYLSTDAAIEDLAVFQKHAMKEFGLKGPWIAVGGSYAGSLAAYYRLAHPELVAGALASSGPVEARARFEEYDYQVATVIPASCLARMKRAVEVIEGKLENGTSKAQVKATFKATELSNDVDFLYAVADMAAAAIQYGERENFCSSIESTTTDETLVKNYARSGLQMLSMLGVTPLEIVAQGNLSEDVRDYTNNGMRQWLYQSCTEYGYWQVAYHDPKFSSRSSRIDLEYHDEICERLFGIRRPVDTRYINKNYYEPLVAGYGSKIFFTNGSDDPWKHLSILPARRNVPATVEAMEIPGAAHCDDLGNGSSAGVKKAQNSFREMLTEWVR